jgi:hypothetical protein
MNQGQRQVPSRIMSSIGDLEESDGQSSPCSLVRQHQLKDLVEVGGKNASIGELSALLAADSGRVPDGFASTAHAYRRRLMPQGPGQSCIASSPISTIVDLGQRRLAAAAVCFATVLT